MTCRLSIVVAVHGNVEGLERMLDALARQRGEDVEILVCAGRDWDRARQACADRAGVCAVQGTMEALTPHLWRDGILRAQAARVAITIAQHLPASDWVQRLLEADLGRYCAIGGAIDIEPGASASGWASYLLRYATYAPGGALKEVADMAGDNAVYDREILLGHREAFAQGFWEPEIHARLRAEGGRILFDPELIVVQQRRFRVMEFASQRFAHGVRFGMDRALRLSWPLRLLYALVAPTAPLVLGLKVWGRAWRNQRLRRRLPQALPLLVFLLLAWGAGETRGVIEALRRGTPS